MVQSRKCTLSNEYWNWLSLRETAHRRARRLWSIFIGSLLPHWLIAFKCKSWSGGNKALFFVWGWHAMLLRFKLWIYFFWSSSNKLLRRKIDSLTLPFLFPSLFFLFLPYLFLPSLLPIPPSFLCPCSFLSLLPPHFFFSFPMSPFTFLFPSLLQIHNLHVLVPWV